MYSYDRFKGASCAVDNFLTVRKPPLTNFTFSSENFLIGLKRILFLHLPIIPYLKSPNLDLDIPGTSRIAVMNPRKRDFSATPRAAFAR